MKYNIQTQLVENNISNIDLDLQTGQNTPFKVIYKAFSKLPQYI